MKPGNRIGSSQRFAQRRRLLCALIGALVVLPMSWISRVFAARPLEAFRAETVEQTLSALFGDRAILPSDQIRIGAAELAENGAVVPIKINTDLAKVKSISIIATENPIPLVAQFEFSGNSTGFVATRIKLATSCDIVAVVETPNGLFQAHKAIEVTIGGCGV